MSSCGTCDSQQDLWHETTSLIVDIHDCHRHTSSRLVSWSNEDDVRIAMVHTGKSSIEVGFDAFKLDYDQNLDDFGHITTIKLCGGKAEHDSGADSNLSGIKPNHPPPSLLLFLPAIKVLYHRNDACIDASSHFVLPCFNLVVPRFPHWFNFTFTFGNRQEKAIH